MRLRWARLGPARLSSAPPPPSPPGEAGLLLLLLRRGSLLSRQRLPPFLTVIWSLAFPAR